MTARALVFVATLAACQPADETEQPPTDTAIPAAPSPSDIPTVAPRAEPPGLLPDAERGEKGARNVLLSWAAAMENRDFASARALFRDPASDTNDYSGYREVTVGFGDTEVEGAAGSLYYVVPVWLTGNGPEGNVRRDGTITLRRVNDVPGSTAEQRRWRIERLEW